LGAQMQHIRQSAVGQGKSCIGLDRLGELFFWAKILFQQQVDTLYEALGRQGRFGGEWQSIAVLPLGMVWHLRAPFIGHGKLVR
jgi:hypothetical protein